MKESIRARLTRILQKADPLPAVAAGFFSGVILAVILPAHLPNAVLAPLPLGEALASAIACELPIAGAITLTGLTRLPSLPRLPLLYRSLLWGYGSLRMYAAMGQSFLYFQYVLGCGLTMLPLCCMTRVAIRCAGGNRILRGPRLYDYLCRSLFYLGLALLTLPLHLYGG